MYLYMVKNLSDEVLQTLLLQVEEDVKHMSSRNKWEELWNLVVVVLERSYRGLHSAVDVQEKWALMSWLPSTQHR